MSKGRIVIISGPSGSGKTTLHDMLLKDRRFRKVLVKSISATTRVPREGEKNGKDYIFMSRKDFLSKRRQGYFLESMKVFDNYYGTPNDNVQKLLEQGKNVLLCIDVKGAKVVSQKCPDALKIFIKTPTLADLAKRLKQRGTEQSAKLQLRLKIAKDELRQARHYDAVVINDDLNKALGQLSEIIAAGVGA